MVPPGYEPGTVRTLTRRLDGPHSLSGRLRDQKKSAPVGIRTPDRPALSLVTSVVVVVVVVVVAVAVIVAWSGDG